RAGTGGAVMSRHRGSPRRAPETLLQPSTRQGKPHPHSHSKGGVAGSPRRRGCVGNAVPTRGKAFPHPDHIGDERLTAGTMTQAASDIDPEAQTTFGAGFSEMNLRI